MNLSQIRRDAARLLREDRVRYAKLVLINGAVTAGISLLLMLVSWFLQYIAPDGGLSNIGTHAMISTIRTLLQLISMLIVPFWDAGMVFCSLRLVHRKHNVVQNLTEGFHRWSSIAVSLLIRGLIYFFVFMGSYLVSSILLSSLPFPPSVIEELTAFTENPSLTLTGGVRIVLIVYLIIFLISLCTMLIPKLYLHRQVIYQIVDDESCGGVQAVVNSRTLMNGNRKKLFLLDMSYWWFYLLELVISVMAAGHLIAAELGIALPISTEAAAWLFPITALLARLVLYWLAKPKLNISYALFYQRVYDNSLKEPEPPQPPRMPWKY